MKILITGGAGFLGKRLVARLLARADIDEIVLVDMAPAEGFADPRVRAVAGDIADSTLMASLVDARTAGVFHLAAVVSGQAEADFELGMRINLDASRLLLDLCRQRGHKPRVVFTSSVAVYGGDLPDVVTDDLALRPASSYGTQKAIAELLLADYSRRGFVDGRVLRLPTVSVRPGLPNKAASSFASGIIREPLNGEDAVCPVAPETRLWLLSPRCAIDCLIHGFDLDADALGRQRAINLPGITVTAGEMVASLRRVAGEEVASRVHWERDAAIERIVGTWPGAWNTARAETLGFKGDANFEQVVRAYIADDLRR
jgi:nucleoside-diphosphate-sugar epimerase